MAETTLDNELDNPVMDETIATEWKRIQESRQTNDEPIETEETTQEVEKPKRDDKGKFSKEKPLEATEEQTDTNTSEEEEKPATELKKAPTSWRKEAQEKFATLPPDIQDEVLKREQDIHKGVESYKEYASKGQTFERLTSPYLATINQLGATPEQATEHLFKTDHALRYGTPQQKIGIVQNIFRDYNISPQDVFDSFQNQPQVDPNVAALYQEINGLKAQQNNWLQSQQQRESDSLLQEVNTFSQGKEHIGTVENEMIALLPSIVSQFPNISYQDKLQKAYDMAVFANPTTRAAELAKQQTVAKSEAQKKAQAAKQASSVNVTSRGTMPVQKPLGSIDDTIRETARSLGMI